MVIIRLLSDESLQNSPAPLRPPARYHCYRAVFAGLLEASYRLFAFVFVVSGKSSVRSLSFGIHTCMRFSLGEYRPNWSVVCSHVLVKYGFERFLACVFIKYASEHHGC